MIYYDMIYYNILYVQLICMQARPDRGDWIHVFPERAVEGMEQALTVETHVLDVSSCIHIDICNTHIK